MFLYFFLLLLLTMRGQEEICIGKKYNLYSTVLDEQRSYQIDIHYSIVNRLLKEVWPQAENLHCFSKSFPEENHGTVVIPGI